MNESQLTWYAVKVSRGVVTFYHSPIPQHRPVGDACKYDLVYAVKGEPNPELLPPPPSDEVVDAVSGSIAVADIEDVWASAGQAKGHTSRRRDCHFADVSSTPLLNRLLE